jgi:hypothetical protein
MAPGHPEEVDKVIEEAKRYALMDYLQAELRESEMALLNAMHDYSVELLTTNRTNVAFIKKLASEANLSDEETSRLLH